MNSISQKEGSVCFLQKDDSFLLLHLNYPNGKYVWSGVGGMKEPSETIEESVIREGKEELSIQIKLKNLKLVGIIKENSHFTLSVFLADQWEGEPTPSEKSIEKLRWFTKNEIPYNEMWPDNKFWLPQILNGKLLTAQVLKDVYTTPQLSFEDVIVNEVTLLQ